MQVPQARWFCSTSSVWAPLKNRARLDFPSNHKLFSWVRVCAVPRRPRNAKGSGRLNTVLCQQGSTRAFYQMSCPRNGVTAACKEAMLTIARLLEKGKCTTDGKTIRLRV